MSNKILVIDDVKDERTLMKRHLVEAGFDVIEAESGEEGIKMARGHKPDIVIVDTKMAGIDGYETCAKIKDVKDLNTKIIVMTGNINDYSSPTASMVNPMRAKTMGADDYCLKSPDCAELKATVEKLLR